MRRAGPLVGVVAGVLAIAFLVALRAKIVGSQLAAADSATSAWLALLVLFGMIAAVVLVALAIVVSTSARTAALARARCSGSAVILLANTTPELCTALRAAGVVPGEIAGPVAFVFDTKSLILMNRRGHVLKQWPPCEVTLSPLVIHARLTNQNGIRVAVLRARFSFVPRRSRPLFTRIVDTERLAASLNHQADRQASDP